MAKRTSSSDNTNSDKKIKEYHSKSALGKFIANIIIKGTNEASVEYDSPCRYLRVGPYIYRNEYINLKSNYIGLSLLQYRELEDYMCNGMIMICPIPLNTRFVGIKEIIISVSNHGKAAKIMAEEMGEYFVEHFNKYVLNVGQNIALKYGEHDYELTVKRIHCLKTTISNGIVTDKTRVSFRNSTPSKLTIYNKCALIDSKFIQIRIIACETTKPEISLPLIVNETELRTIIGAKLPKTFVSGDKFTIEYAGYIICLCIKIIGINAGRLINVYQMKTDGNNFHLDAVSTDVIITTETHIADQLSISFQAYRLYKYSPTDYVVNMSDVTKFILNGFKYVVIGQKIAYQYGKCRAWITIDNILPHSNNKFMYQIVKPDLTLINSSSMVPSSMVPSTALQSPTSIVYNEHTDSKFIPTYGIVKLAQSVTMEVKQIEKPNMETLLDLLIDKDNDILETTDLEIAIRGKITVDPKLIVGQEIIINYFGTEYIIKVTDLTFDKPDPDSKYRIWGTVSSQTKLQFKSGSKSITINDTVNIVEDAVSELKNFVGGVNEQLKEVTRSLCLSRGKLREEFMIRGIKPYKGIVFYGPPGTGKTSLARQLGKMLGCTGNRFKLLSGPEIFNKWVGQSEKNVRDLFKPAKDAWALKGPKAPLFMIVIDEVDAIFGRRDNSTSNPVRNSVVNQFLAEIDGLIEFNNMICIGLTNKLELLDSAILRPGRLGIHIKIDLPDRKGRIEIFDIHIKNLRTLDRIEKINLTQLADLTDGFSGADIEGIVQSASILSLDRLNKLDNLDDTIIQTAGKITMKDFTNAISHFKKSTNRRSDVPLNLYI